MSSIPSKDPLHSGDAHPVHYVSGEPEGNGFRGWEDLPLLERHTLNTTIQQSYI